MIKIVSVALGSFTGRYLTSLAVEAAPGSDFPYETLTANFTRVEVFGSADNSWVEMTVDPKSENVFSFKQVVLN